MREFMKFSFDNMWNVVFETGMPEGEFTHDGYNARLSGDGYTIETNTEEKDGMYCRRDSITNTSSSPVFLTAVRSRFLLQRSEYEFYTQYNAWQNESVGGWTASCTGVTASSQSLRTAVSANPLLGIWDNQTGRGIAFHLIPGGSWLINASYVSYGGKNGWLLVEMGIAADNLRICLQPGETFCLPEIWFYEFRNKNNMDSHILQKYALKRYSGKESPVIYNTWLYKFDRFSFDNISAQIPVAADMGCEYFVIDAGWFGNGPGWTKQIGDWSENMTSGFMGRTKELSDLVRKNGMKFGLWVEPTRAVEGSAAAKKHKDLFIQNGRNYFLDFANPDAVKYITDIIDGLIEEYNIEYFKFDDNADLTFDRYRSGFTMYYQGYDKFMQRMREKYPHIYFQGCASGGQKMNLSAMKYFDSLWPTDNQGVYFGTRLLKDTALRLPVQMIDRWAVITSINSFDTYTCDNAEHIVSTGDATCDYITGVDLSYLKGFLSGGPIGFSCNLASLSKETFTALKEHISEFKKDRGFLKTALCRVLADTKSLTVLQYSDENLSKITLQVFTSDLAQEGVTLYPVVSPDKNYICGDKTLSAAEIDKNGIYLPLSGSYKMNSITLIEQ